jgi:hypothetical protein
MSPFLAQSGLMETLRNLSAFGAKRTCTANSHGWFASLMTSPDMDATVRTQSLLLFENRPIHLTRITVHLTFELDRNP